MIKNSALYQSVVAFKLKLARSLMLSLVIVCVIGLPISLARWPDIGFQAIFIVHIFVTVIAFIFYFKKEKSHYQLDMLVVVGLLTIMSVSGVLSFGLQSGAMAFSVFCTFIIAIAWGAKVAYAYAVAWCVFVLSIGYLVTNGYLALEVSPSEYSNTAGAWAIVAVGSSLIIIFMLIIAKQGYDYLETMIETIDEQKQKIETLANLDSMTGCLAGRLSKPKIQQAIDIANNDGTKLAIVFIDMNDFKRINDNYGHHTGDDVLITFAKRLKAVLRSIDDSFRIGGDEFLLLLPKLQSEQEVINIVERIIQTWQEPVHTSDTQITISGSIGIALYPEHGSNSEELRENADAAMYKAKQTGKAFHLFSPRYDSRLSKLG